MWSDEPRAVLADAVSKRDELVTLLLQPHHMPAQLSELDLRRQPVARLPGDGAARPAEGPLVARCHALRGRLPGVLLGGPEDRRDALVVSRALPQPRAQPRTRRPG